MKAKLFAHTANFKNMPATMLGKTIGKARRGFLTFLAILAFALFSLPFLSQSLLKNPSLVQAQSNLEEVEIQSLPEEEVELFAEETASPSSEATESAEAIQKIQEKKDQDITETTSQQRSKLATFLLEENPPSPLSWHNILQHAIRRAISNGLPANIVVLVILFPVITSIIATSRHLIGLKGFGVYAPAVLSVAFVSTGISSGLVMFIIVMLTALISRRIVSKFKLQYLPRTAMMLWGVSVAVLILLVATSFFGLTTFLTISIFPLLIIMLLTENFIETQLMTSQSQALRLTLETVIIAIICSLIISLEPIQKAVLLYPEITVLSVAVFNIIVGRYSGLRFLEYFRFRSIIER